MIDSQEMIQSKHRQDVLEARMSRMVGVLMQACHSIGLTPIENGDGGNNLLQILDCDTSDSIRSPAKRPRLLENAPMSPILDKHTVPLEGLKFQVFYVANVYFCVDRISPPGLLLRHVHTCLRTRNLRHPFSIPPRFIALCSIPSIMDIDVNLLIVIIQCRIQRTR